MGHCVEPGCDLSDPLVNASLSGSLEGAVKVTMVVSVMVDCHFDLSRWVSSEKSVAVEGAFVERSSRGNGVVDSTPWSVSVVKFCIVSAMVFIPVEHVIVSEMVGRMAEWYPPWEENDPVAMKDSSNVAYLGINTAPSR